MAYFSHLSILSAGTSIFSQLMADPVTVPCGDQSFFARTDAFNFSQFDRFDEVGNFREIRGNFLQPDFFYLFAATLKRFVPLTAVNAASFKKGLETSVEGIGNGGDECGFNKDVKVGIFQFQ